MPKTGEGLSPLPCLKEYKMGIRFVQYMRPDGHQKLIYITIDEDYDRRANVILNEGFVFEIEVLTTGEVSMTISNDEADLFIEICENGPAVVEHVKKLIDNFYSSNPGVES